MKKLCLFRHAKSTYASLGTDDLDRPLHEIGSYNAPMMANVLVKIHKFKPDLILTSHAKRASETAKLIADVVGYNSEKIHISEKLYEPSVEELIHEIQFLDNKFKSVLLVGHNPGLTLLANFLTDQHVNNLPTCGIVSIEFDTNKWENFAEADNKILFTDEPKNHQ